MGIAILSLIVLLIAAILVVPVLARVFRQAADRDPTAPDREDGDDGRR